MATKCFVWIQIGVAVSFASTFALVGNTQLSGINLALQPIGWAFFSYSLWVGFITLFPGAFFIGASFPLAVTILAGQPANNEAADRVASLASARVYSFNTVGAIIGAVLTSFILLPTFKYAQTTFLLVLLSLGIALSACLIKPSSVSYTHLTLPTIYSV